MSSRREGREGERGRKRKRSRWAPAEAVIIAGGTSIPKNIPGNLTVEQQEALMVRVRIDELTRKLNFNDLDMGLNERRSPSPEPTYDQNGKRLNTREQRVRDKLSFERQTMVELAMFMNPHFKPPADYTPFSTKRTRRIYVPQDKYPEYNFIGLILGPRGNTQKKMEKDTGCRIVIRGKGSVKEGNRGRKDGKPNTGDDDALHVLITADYNANLEKAVKMVEDLLVPKDEGSNEHKRLQLEELARINGTLRDKGRNPESGLRSTDQTVKCGICGELSHPSSDCPLRGKGGVSYSFGASKTVESEFDKFLTEIGETPAQQAKQADADNYDDFMSAVGGTGSVPPWMTGQQQAHGAPPPWASQPQQQQQQQQAPWLNQGHQGQSSYPYQGWQ